MKPQRIQLSRRKGFKLVSPNSLPVVVVSRPHRWGNPFKVGGYVEVPNRQGSTFRLVRDQASAVHWFKAMLKQGGTPPFTLANIREELRGKNLACWCKSPPCHADVLLEIANAETLSSASETKNIDCPAGPDTRDLLPRDAAA